MRVRMHSHFSYMVFAWSFLCKPKQIKKWFTRNGFFSCAKKKHTKNSNERIWKEIMKISHWVKLIANVVTAFRILGFTLVGSQFIIHYRCKQHLSFGQLTAVMAARWRPVVDQPTIRNHIYISAVILFRSRACFFPLLWPRRIVAFRVKETLLKHWRRHRCWNGIICLALYVIKWTYNRIMASQKKKTRCLFYLITNATWILRNVNRC